MDGIGEAHARLLKDPSIQFEWPASAAVDPPLPSPPGSPALGHSLFWVILVVAVGLAVAMLVPRLRGLSLRRRTTFSGGSSKAVVPVEVALPQAGLEQADDLAADGRYGEAVHALLLNGIEAIGRRFPRSLSRSSTSRDIAGLAVLPAPMREAFATIAFAAERAVFAGRVLGRADWDTCRARYAALADAHP